MDSTITSLDRKIQSMQSHKNKKKKKKRKKKNNNLINTTMSNST